MPDESRETSLQIEKEIKVNTAKSTKRPNEQSNEYESKNNEIRRQYVDVGKYTEDKVDGKENRRKKRNEERDQKRARGGKRQQKEIIDIDRAIWLGTIELGLVAVARLV